MIPTASLRIRAPRFLVEYRETAHRYYQTHFRFVLSVFACKGCSIEYFTPQLTDDTSRVLLQIWIDELKILFDVSDYPELPEPRLLNEVDAAFKFHYLRSTCHTARHVFPFSPISFYDWAQFRTLSEEIQYSAQGIILNKQRPHTQNYVRRTHVKALLAERYRSEELDLEVTEQVDFWRCVNNSLIAVCVPGARLDILDRGQLQYMSFGACTVSPRLSIDLPYGEQLIPNVHYLECDSDWSDVVDKIEWAKTHRSECIEIGRNAKQLFSRALTADALFAWVLSCLERVGSEDTSSTREVMQ